MFGLFNKEKFICLGVNPNADWSNMDSIITPLNLHEYLKPKVYTKENIKEIQNRLNQKDIPYKDISNEFNWISEKQNANLKTISFSLISVISGVRQEFETSEPHIEIFEKYIAPSIIKSLTLGSGEIKYDIEDVESNYLDKGVIVPLHFDRVQVFDRKIKDEKTGKVFRNLEIKQKLEPHSLEPKGRKKVNILINTMLQKIELGDTNILIEENELLEILKESEKLRCEYRELEAYYYLGVINIKIALFDKAENYIYILINTPNDISKMTIAKDFLRPIGELFEENGNASKALFWFKKAIEFSPAIGLKKKITQLEKNLNL